jgi:CRP/FNR family transcriptional regulator, cyclic AMP receptor protein
MAIKNGQCPAPIRLTYKEGELIMKQGGFGNSIFQIIDGKVRLSAENSEREVTLAILEKDELFGESSFFNRSTGTRQAGAYAVTRTVLLVRHANRLIQDYETLPPIFRNVMTDSLRRLSRHRLLTTQLEFKPCRESDEHSQARQDFAAQQRKNYRKEVSFPCSYRPLETALKIPLTAIVRDISMGGMGIEVSNASMRAFNHAKGEQFIFDVPLPIGHTVQFTAAVVANKPARNPKARILGVNITDISYQNQKQLGFFLMP